MTTVLLVASSGGHTDELYDFAQRLPAETGELVWVTARTAQTESLLSEERVEWVPQIAARQGVRAVRSIPTAMRLIRRYRPTAVLSTGAALSVPYLLAARLHRIPTHYIDSATRLTSPSVTGRMVSRLPGVHLHHQGNAWTDERWARVDSVFDRYVAQPCDAAPHEGPAPLAKVVVTLGSEQFDFSRAIDVVRSGIDPGWEVLWQVGHTTAPADLPGTVHEWVPYRDLRAAIESADVMVTHAGVGSILAALRCGLCPVVIPRLEQFAEHVDDHQLELAQMLAARGLVVVVEPGGDIAEAVAVARATSVTRRPMPDLFPLR